MVGDRSMLQETALRAAKIDGSGPPIVVCNEDHRFLAAEQMRQIGITPKCIILEPVGRNTAPAITAAALALEGSRRLMLVLPADHMIRNGEKFSNGVHTALLAAASGYLLAFGIVPSGPETGYGYIECGASLPIQGGYLISRFVEKPDLVNARLFVDSGKFLWNSGMFMMMATLFLEEIERHRPDIVSSVNEAWKKRTQDADFVRLDAVEFKACPADSVDYAVMERTQKAAVIPVDIGWSDVGSWSSLWENSAKDADGNAIRGDVDVSDTHNSYLRAEHRLLSVNGLDNVVVVETSDAVLVSSRAKTQSVKDIVSRLNDRKRLEHITHRRVYRPWGFYETVDEDQGFQVKRLVVQPGNALSLQLHRHRSEHWVIVSGTARVTRGEEVLTLSRNESIYIPVGVKHRLENVTKLPLHIIEVQSGDYLSEDDIVRFEDRYSRP